MPSLGSDVHTYICRTMNYNQSPCKVSITKIVSEHGDIEIKLSKGNVLDKLFNKVAQPLISIYLQLIINYVESKLESVINEPLEHFNCEKYRP